MKGDFLNAVCCLLAASPLLAADYHAKTQPEAAAPNAETQSAPLVLNRTPAAPLDAGGSVEFGPSTLLFHIQGLSPGLYWLNVVTRPDGSIVPLGVIPIFDPTAGPSDQAHENFKQPSNAYPSETLVTQAQAWFPPGLDARNVAQITISGYGGNVYLTTGSLSPALY